MWRIVGWQEHFENNRTRELQKLSWVPFPNKHDGDGFTELLDHKDGVAHYGVWCVLVQVASKCDPRGTLSRDGARPHTTTTLARMTRIPEPVLRAAIDRLVSKIGWLESVGDETTCIESQPGATESHPSAAFLNGMEGKEKKEQKGTDIEVLFERFWKAFPGRRKTNKRKASEAFSAACKRADAETIIAAAVEFATSDKGTGEYCPMPTTWLNGDCWNDDRAAWSNKPKQPETITVGEFTF